MEKFSVRILGIVLSLFIHLFVFNISSCSSKNRLQDLTQDTEVSTRLVSVHEKIIDIPSENVQGWEMSKKESGPPCEKNKQYEGVGLRFSGFTGAIIEVLEGSPAQKAGIRVGDFLVDPFSSNPIVDGYKTIAFRRDGNSFELKIKTEVICYE